MTRIDTAYLALLQSIQQKPTVFFEATKKVKLNEGDDGPIVALYPMRGRASTVDVMFIGRALNSWTWNFPVPDDVTDLDDLLAGIKVNVGKGDTIYPTREQLRWVDDRDGTHHSGYNSNQSQFWQAIKGIMGSREPDPTIDDTQWWDGIVWTNFHKLSHKGGNPTRSMNSVMGTAALDLLRAEITTFQPKNIVCLSGLDWATGLLASCDKTIRKADCAGLSYVDYVDDVSVDGTKARLLVAEHPQGRKREVLVRKVTQHLA